MQNTVLEKQSKSRKAVSNQLAQLPTKRYLTISEASLVSGVKPHVLRYWEEEFPQLCPTKRRGNRRYYRHEDLVIIQQIRQLLYEQGFTISGAKRKLATGKAVEERQLNVNAQKVIRDVIIELRELEALFDDR